MAENKNRRKENETKVEIDQLEKMHREAVEADGCSDSDLEQVAGGNEVSAI
jgi:hypothetical protein